ncbi:MAG: hypothetical protein HY002_10045 [Candidatus Rokubacteria bacterium]|nr:hypothetical protein [Candidatus Rokubacteria bacterium]
MSPVDAAIIRRKLQHIMAALDGLRPITRLSRDEYQARFYERKAAERLLQEASIGALVELHPRYVRAVEAYLAKAGL